MDAEAMWTTGAYSPPTCLLSRCLAWSYVTKNSAAKAHCIQPKSPPHPHPTTSKSLLRYQTVPTP